MEEGESALESYSDVFSDADVNTTGLRQPIAKDVPRKELTFAAEPRSERAKLSTSERRTLFRSANNAKSVMFTAREDTTPKLATAILLQTAEEDDPPAVPRCRVGVWIFASSVIQLFVLVTIVISILYYSWVAEGERSAVLILDTSKIAVDCDIRHDLPWAHRATGLVGEAVTLGELPAHSLTMAKHLACRLEHYEVHTVGVGFADGSFAIAKKQAPGSYLIGEVSAGSRLRYDFDYHVSSATVTAVSGPTEFNVLERPWYQAIVRENTTAPLWTAPYVFASSDKVGITAARPLYSDGLLTAVVMVDVSYGEVMVALEKVVVAAETGVAHVLDREGRVVTSSTGVNTILTTDRPSNTFTALKLVDMPDEPSSTSGMLLDESLGRGWERTISGTVHLLEGEMYVRADVLRDAHGLELISTMGLPKSELLGSSSESLYVTIAVAGVAFMLSALLAAATSKKTTNSLHRIRGDLQQLYGMDYSLSKDRKRSRFQELFAIEESVRKLKRGWSFFSKFVPSEVVRVLMSQEEHWKLHAAHREISVFFSEVDGFSAFSEQAEPDVMINQLAEYLDLLGTVLVEKEGTVDKHIGDRMLAFFNAPGAVDRHAEKACIAALESETRLKDLREDWRKRGWEPLYQRVGLHVCNPMVGLFGTSQRVSYTAIGEGVNLSSRLGGIAKRYGVAIICTEEIKDMASPVVAFRELDDVNTGGMTEKTTLYEVVGLEVDRTEDQRVLAAKYGAALNKARGKKFDRAVRLCDELLELFPNDMPTHMLRSRCLQRV